MRTDSSKISEVQMRRSALLDTSSSTMISQQLRTTRLPLRAALMESVMMLSFWQPCVISSLTSWSETSERIGSWFRKHSMASVGKVHLDE